MFFGRKIHGGDEISRLRLSRVSLLPLFENLHSLLVLAQPRLAQITPEVKRLDAGGSPDHCADGAVWRLGQEGHVPGALLADRFADVVGHLTHVAGLEEL